MRLSILCLIGLIGAACAETTEVDAPAAPAVEPGIVMRSAAAVSGPGVYEGSQICDAGDEAFVRRVLPQLWGRRAWSIREVEVLLDVVAARGREGLLRAMMGSPEYVARWSDALKDMLFINRAGSRANPDCFAEPVLPAPTTALASHIREHGPLDAPYTAEWNMTDLVTSSVMLDDLTPLLRGHLFTQAGSEIIDADDPNDELAWRQAYSDIFERVYLNRRMTCLSCHNSEFAVTDDLDEARDRHWPVEGLFEKAIYGASAGRPAKDLASLFRIKGVLSLVLVPEGPEFWMYAPGKKPWGLYEGCGQFTAPDEITPDPEGGDGQFIEDIGPTASIWDAERLLRRGFDDIPRDGAELDTATLAQSPYTALAFMVAMSVAEKVFTEVTAQRLTTPNSFPRNRYQRDLLAHLAKTFVRGGFSLRELLVAVLTHPYMNPAPPSECEGVDVTYPMAPVFNPWVTDNEVEEERHNGVGELITRLPARVLMESVVSALEWTPSRHFFPDQLEEGVQLEPEAAFQRDIGVFLRDGETGFRGANFQEALAWEYAYGSCEDPAPDASPAPDFVRRLVEMGGGHTLADGVIALKDRLLADPTLTPDEAALMAPLAGMALDSPLGESEAGLRRICAALLAAPQYVLQGLPLPDRAGKTVPIVAAGQDGTATCARIAGALFPPAEAHCEGGRLVFQ